MGKLTDLIFMAGVVVSGHLPAAMAQSGALNMEMEKKGAEEMVLKKMDVNHDGQISRKEYMQVHEKMFEQIDHDGDGLLNSKDIARMDGCMMHGMPQDGMSTHDKINGRAAESNHMHDEHKANSSSSADYPHALTH